MAMNLMCYEACMQALKDHDNLNSAQLNSRIIELEAQLAEARELLGQAIANPRTEGLDLCRWTNRRDKWMEGQKDE